MHPLAVHLVGAEERLEMIRLQQGFGVGTGNVAVEIIELAEEVGGRESRYHPRDSHNNRTDLRDCE